MINQDSGEEESRKWIDWEFGTDMYTELYLMYNHPGPTV